MIRLQQTGHALGTDCVITIIEDDQKAKHHFQALWAQIHAFEARFSRFQPDSELTRVNHAAGTETSISNDFYKLMARALELNGQTHGLYNPLVLPALQQAGYKGSWPTPTVASDTIDYSQREIGDITALKLIPTSVMLPDNSALDFGGIGKGYLLDELANYLDTQHVKHYWLSLGGDIVMNGYDVEQRPWRVGIASVTDQDEPIAFVDSPQGERRAVATSAITKRKGAGWHHIIDPRNGRSADTDILSSTVVTSDATEADVLAKCFIIVGSDAAEDFASQQPVSNGYLLQLIDETTINTLH